LIPQRYPSRCFRLPKRSCACPSHALLQELLLQMSTNGHGTPALLLRSRTRNM
jgi:hypothetical protein